MLAQALLAHTDTLATTASLADPDALVPTCPEWTIRRLVTHVGQAHRYSTTAVRTHQAAPASTADPGPQQNWRTWLTGGAEDLLAALRTTGPDTEVWTRFGTRRALFWLRRMTHDTVVHNVDAALTTGAEFKIEDSLAADGITEYLELAIARIAAGLLPSVERLRGDGETIRLNATTGQTWLITRTSTGISTDLVAGQADVTATGSPQDLLLLLTRRTSQNAPQIAVTGGQELLEHLLASTDF
ncbi:maleylpyruvate isomerase family mycothiol-dependent enzyme [Actinokineospora sp. NBRC 105648]|uniref:maleylpyruvate isomerase family mycothiol-dependent enzyme n=1 Tax=Actinokineospora sp. NBRC 105648 TaxID=3032206 RepID=UPI002556DD60|nr:maleylpyruvate isomerase family mycothiol-dependent enzyme [Actinokineospora sp. NBRC 105648]